MNSNASTNYPVPSSFLPTNESPYRRAYYFRACSSSNECSAYNTPIYVYKDQSAPGAPGPTTVSGGCAYITPGTSECWRRGSFTIQVAPAADSGSGVGSYQVCRSNNSTGGYAGCQTTVGTTTQPSYWISGTNRPSDGYRRAYYFRAKDQLGNGWGPWSAGLYVRVDRYNPTISANNASLTWFDERTVTISASDTTGDVANVGSANAGLKEVRYQWNIPLNGTCTDGNLLFQQSATGSRTFNLTETISVPSGDNHLYLCAKDNTSNNNLRMAFWDGGPYRVNSVIEDGIQPYVFGCGQWSACATGTGYAYDPSILMENGTLEVYVQGKSLQQPTHDSIIEYNLDMSSPGALPSFSMVSTHLGSGCATYKPASPGEAGANPAASPAVLDRGEGKRILFYSRGNADAIRGRISVAYKDGGTWTDYQQKTLFYPLCSDGQSVPESAEPNDCAVTGVARVAAADVGGYYYLYLETIAGNRTGILVMRVLKSAQAPYVNFSQGGAELYNASTGTWSALKYGQLHDPASEIVTKHKAPTHGYYTELCSTYTADDLVNSNSFYSWSLLDGRRLGDVSLVDGKYTLTFHELASSSTKYRSTYFWQSNTPEFAVLTANDQLNLDNIFANCENNDVSTTFLASRQPNDVLFFTNFRQPACVDLGDEQNLVINYTKTEVRVAIVDPTPKAMLLDQVSTEEPVSGLFPVTGWLDDLAGAATVSFEIDGKGVDLSQLAYGIPRDETCANDAQLERPCKIVGFTGDLDTSLFANGRHTLTLKVVDQDGQSHSYSREIHIEN